MAKLRLGETDETRKWYAKATARELTDPELKRFRDDEAGDASMTEVNFVVPHNQGGN